MTENKYALLLLLSVLISAISQVLLKKSATERHGNVVREYLNAKVIGAYVLFFAAVLIDLAALRYVPASFVPVIETSSYAFLMLLGRIVFQGKNKQSTGSRHGHHRGRNRAVCGVRAFCVTGILYTAPRDLRERARNFSNGRHTSKSTAAHTMNTRRTEMIIKSG